MCERLDRVYRIAIKGQILSNFFSDTDKGAYWLRGNMSSDYR